MKIALVATILSIGFIGLNQAEAKSCHNTKHFTCKHPTARLVKPTNKSHPALMKELPVVVKPVERT